MSLQNLQKGLLGVMSLLLLSWIWGETTGAKLLRQMWEDPPERFHGTVKAILTSPESSPEERWAALDALSLSLGQNKESSRNWKDSFLRLRDESCAQVKGTYWCRSEAGWTFGIRKEGQGGSPDREVLLVAQPDDDQVEFPAQGQLDPSRSFKRFGETIHFVHSEDTANPPSGFIIRELESDVTSQSIPLETATIPPTFHHLSFFKIRGKEICRMGSAHPFEGERSYLAVKQVLHTFVESFRCGDAPFRIP